MYYFYVEIEYVATSFSPARTDLALKLLTALQLMAHKYAPSFFLGFVKKSYLCQFLSVQKSEDMKN
jgi:hypothetical protein